MFIGANPFTLKGYIVPILFGGTAGVVIAVLKQKWEFEAARVGTEKLQALIDMAGAVCHEMNQPMQAVFGYSELLLIDISEGNPLHSDLQKIKGQIDRMGEITRKLMQVTKYETKDYVFEGKKIIDIDRASGSA